MEDEGPYTDGYDLWDKTATLTPSLADRAATRRDRCRSPVPDRVGNLTVRPFFFHRIDWSAVRLLPKQEGGTHQCAA